MEAAPEIGDTVDVGWPDGRQDIGMVERIAAGTVRLHIAGPPEIFLLVRSDQLVKVRPHHWTLG
jgi:hypothetical protein